MKRLIKMWDGSEYTTKNQKDTINFIDKHRWKIASMEKVVEAKDKELLLVQYMNRYLWRKDLELSGELYFWDWIQDRFFHAEDWEFTVEQDEVISKRFWFIHWLLEKWHLDKDAMREKVMRFLLATFRPLEDDFIMYLAIQDKPIDELIACLK